MAPDSNVSTQRGGKVVLLSDTYGGKKQDKKIAEEENYEFSSESILWQNTGFQGYAPEGVTVKQPKKKPRRAALSDEQKRENQAVFSVRVEVES